MAGHDSRPCSTIGLGQDPVCGHSLQLYRVKTVIADFLGFSRLYLSGSRYYLLRVTLDLCVCYLSNVCRFRAIKVLANLF